MVPVNLSDVIVSLYIFKNEGSAWTDTSVYPHVLLLRIREYDVLPSSPSQWFNSVLTDNLKGSF